MVKIVFARCLQVVDEFLEGRAEKKKRIDEAKSTKFNGDVLLGIGGNELDLFVAVLGLEMPNDEVHVVSVHRQKTTKLILETQHYNKTVSINHNSRESLVLGMLHPGTNDL